MAQASIEEDRLKELLKTAIVEVFEERRELLLDVFVEALEDVALAHAIEQGERGSLISREALWEAEERATAEAYARQPDSPDAAFDPAIWVGMSI